MEVVGQNYDFINEEGETAPLTFILKDIFFAYNFRNQQNFYWITPNGEKIVHNLAGGWTKGNWAANDPSIADTDYPKQYANKFYENISKIIFLNDGEILNEKIKAVRKKVDFGPLSTERNTEYYPTTVLNERIWTPSATEMGITIGSDKEEAKQGGDGTKGGYAWFTNNESRVKINKYRYFGNLVDKTDGPDGTYYDYDSPTPYWTRTWYGDTWNFFGVERDGARKDMRSFWNYGLIFGFCI